MAITNDKFNKVNGQAMVEFLVVLPILLLLVLGILQFAFIYQAKVTLNYAAFQSARAGALNHASISTMETAFASNMAPLYTTSYTSIDSSDTCSSNFDLGNELTSLGTQNVVDQNIQGTLNANIANFNSDNVICARRKVLQEIEDGYASITVVNPSPFAFDDFAIDGDDGPEIPNDNLMYRDSAVAADSAQSLQDANLLKIHVGYCFELIVPFANRIIWAMQRYGPGSAPPEVAGLGRPWADDTAAPPGFFGAPQAGSFAESCIVNPADDGRFSIVLYSQGIIRMQSNAKQCEITDTCTAP